ncbi:RNA-binding domain-containing protein [Neoconidiobolus thromboides FSU 785]|nr:RNA-binding domain-containing protein [Neoconidiobolus thromboides FSU 785]
MEDFKQPENQKETQDFTIETEKEQFLETTTNHEQQAYNYTYPYMYPYIPIEHISPNNGPVMNYINYNPNQQQQQQQQQQQDNNNDNNSSNNDNNNNTTESNNPNLNSNNQNPILPSIPPYYLISPTIYPNNQSSPILYPSSPGGSTISTKMNLKYIKANKYPNSYTTNVYIRGLPPNTTDEALFNMCSGYGMIVSSKSIIDPKSNLCRGYGFVMYEYLHQAQYAIHCLSMAGFDASFAKIQNQSDNNNNSSNNSNVGDNDSDHNGQNNNNIKMRNNISNLNTNVYVSNLPLNYNEKDLETLFSPYKIISCRVLRDQNQLSKGVALARMIDRESSDIIIEKFNNYKLLNGQNELQVRYADSNNNHQHNYNNNGSYYKNKNKKNNNQNNNQNNNNNNQNYFPIPFSPNHLPYFYAFSPTFYPVDNNIHLSPNPYLPYPTMSPYFNGHPYPNQQVNGYPIYYSNQFSPSTGELTPLDTDHDVEEIHNLMNDKLNLDDDDNERLKLKETENTIEKVKEGKEFVE